LMSLILPKFHNHVFYINFALREELFLDFVDSAEIQKNSCWNRKAICKILDRAHNCSNFTILGSDFSWWI